MTLAVFNTTIYQGATWKRTFTMQARARLKLQDLIRVEQALLSASEEAEGM